MSDSIPAPKSNRPWQDVAAELSQEKDPAKISKLAQELSRAIDEQEGIEKAPKSP
jgi:hypothetical protein